MPRYQFAMCWISSPTNSPDKPVAVWVKSRNVHQWYAALSPRCSAARGCAISCGTCLRGHLWLKHFERIVHTVGCRREGWLENRLRPATASLVAVCRCCCCCCLFTSPSVLHGWARRLSLDALSQVQEGKYKRAKEYFNAALVANPKHAAAWHGLGMLEMNEGNLVAARDTFKQGIGKVDEPSPFLYEGIGRLAAGLGLAQEARYWFREGTNSALGAKSNALWGSWGHMEWKVAGDTEQARYCFEMALKIFDRNRYVHLTWASMEKSLSNVDEAARILREGIKKNPTDAALQQVLLCAAPLL
jgi:tetratricopeptide (TPR) repeat protein